MMNNKYKLANKQIETLQDAIGKIFAIENENKKTIAELLSLAIISGLEGAVYDELLREGESIRNLLTDNGQYTKPVIETASAYTTELIRELLKMDRERGKEGA